ncbi:hypothetical protein AXG93_4242s1260 [Marchantia polymorpha subsp. ruderalis]|uniref:Uncharacterized protein n=1 Tax=Marchantia polymorpha subsp. ruderalis TaxID=1480154 RepID=A0A176VVM6_MARPO|nr:hypothetical protein AXG93_4242s1260 [Marchantia polymorpha subsp. ruderalis]
MAACRLDLAYYPLPGQQADDNGISQADLRGCMQRRGGDSCSLACNKYKDYVRVELLHVAIATALQSLTACALVDTFCRYCLYNPSL